MEISKDLTGETFQSAETSLHLVEQSIQDRRRMGFESYEAVSEFAFQHNLDLMAYSKSAHGFYHATHRGDLLTEREWCRMYSDVLFYNVVDGEKQKKVQWFPDSYLSRKNALLVGERTDGVREPLYERNYFIPTGARNPETGRFNIAIPFKYYARETGADTSFIYRLLENLAGECYLHLLSWLRFKIMNPKRKTEVVPIFTGSQGTGKSTFGELLCKALFGEENVIVSHSFDGSSRFNADQSDALVVCIEEKTQDDRRNATSVLKSMSTAKTVRKENKGVDPFYQDSYTEFVMTTNELVPIKFDSMQQRRFMVMEADHNFRRAKSSEREMETHKLADEVFAKLYGSRKDGTVIGPALPDNKPVVEQFKYELAVREDLPNYKDFPETDGYRRCFNIPRSTEMTTIDSILRALAPFILQSLDCKRIVREISREGMEPLKLKDITEFQDAIIYINKRADKPDRIAICRPLVFQDENFKQYSHASVDACVHVLEDWFEEEFGIVALKTAEPPSGYGFSGLSAKFQRAPTLYFTLKNGAFQRRYDRIHDEVTVRVQPIVSDKFNVNYNPCCLDEPVVYECLNPLRPGSERKSSNCVSMDMFLLEADDTTTDVVEKENARLQTCGGSISAQELYEERLKVQKMEGNRLMRDGVVCRMVYSGMKSIHMLVRVKDAPNNKEERSWLDAYLKMSLSNRLIFDLSTSDAARLTRAPVRFNREVEINGVKVSGTQELIAEQLENVYTKNWRPLYNQWKTTKRAQYEISDRKMLPSKAIYKDAAIALMDGSFWTDVRWDGQRNTLFFVAYRLIRMMGHTEAEVWANIETDVQNYKKKKEITYWTSRRECSLIKDIEGEIEDAD